MSGLSSNSSHVAELMARFRDGDHAAAGQLVSIFYPELRRLAGAHMVRERGGHTWQPTSLVNELYLELIKINALPAREAGAAPERAAFFGLAAHLMRRLLIHHARPLASRVEKVEVPELPDHSNSLEVLAEIEDVLDRLGSIDAKLRTVVEAKVFEGLTTKEIAAHMGCGTATVERHWSFARRWLSQELGKTADT